MSRILSITVLGIALFAGTAIAVSSINIDHSHNGADVVDHAAPLDGNGCHQGPSGFHCH